MHTMQCDVTRCIIYISNNFEYFDKEYTKILQKKLYFEFKLSLQYNQENDGQNLVSYRHFVIRTLTYISCI